MQSLSIQAVSVQPFQLTPLLWRAEKVALQVLHESAISHMTTQRFSQWEIQMLQQSHQFVWKTVLLETINSP